MNKTKMILAVTGGVIGLAVLAMAYLTWNAFAAKTAALEGDEEEGTDGLETVMERAESLSRLTPKHPVYPCKASVDAIKANQDKIDDWRAEATKLVTRGDRVFPTTTAAQFKDEIVKDAKRLAMLPGAVSGALVKPDFAFGPFREYIVEGKMPAEAQLAELRRRWDDVSTLVEILAKSGVAELTDVQFKAEEKKDEVQETKGKKKGPKAKDKGQKPASAIGNPSSYAYVLTFTTKPAGLVKALNALMVCERFVTVDDFTFGRAKDALGEALGGTEKKKDTAAQGRRRGRRRGAAVQEEKEDEKGAADSGIVTDPLLEEPISVVLTATVSDFHSLEEQPGETAPADKKGASK